MSSTKKTGFVLNVFCLSLLGLPLLACEGVDGDAGASDSTPPGEREVVSMVVGRDGQVQTTRVRMTETEWQQILARRDADEATGPRGDRGVDQIRQAQTISGNCSDGTWSLFYVGPNNTPYCLKNDGWDGTSPSMALDVGLAIRSYRIGKYSSRALICTSSADCNMYECGKGGTVWFDAGGACDGHLCQGIVPQPPYQTYMSPHWVHMQAAAPFPCY